MGKLRDIYPITLLTLNNSLKVFYNNQVNQLYSLCIQLFIGVYKKNQSIKLPDNVGFKKTSNKEFVTMMTVKN